jgi:hypothetical protein
MYGGAERFPFNLFFRLSFLLTAGAQRIAKALHLFFPKRLAFFGFLSLPDKFRTMQ